MHHWQTILLSILILASCSHQEAVKPKPSAAKSERAQVAIKTMQGTMIVELFNETPLHRDNFLKLVETGFYDSLLLHRVQAGFMVQGGDPDSRGIVPPEKRLGFGQTEQRIKAEINTQFIMRQGALCGYHMGLGMQADKSSNGSQFMLIHGQAIKELAFDLIKLYAKRKSTPGIQYPPDCYLQNELEASFIYEDTPDQAIASQDVKEDMMKAYPMDRLVCGDVGFGKTEVAIRAAFKAILAGKQVAVLVPTTILALQHAQTFRERLKAFDIKVEYINRFRTSREKTAIYKSLEAGDIDLLIGTHAILNKKVKFKDLGLLVVDEEQKFGVGSKEKLRNIRVNVDTLTLTATPIPRTLQFSLLAARDMSVINTPPPNRQPIETELRMFNGDMIKEVIENEVARGGQVFLVHNRVKSLAEMASMVKQLCPNVDIAMAHGQMDATALEQTLLDFIKGYYEVLVCTNIIETGLDISNANTIIINNAHQFGLSDLHQLRGRVGRSNKKAYCYLLAPPMSTLSTDARKRLKTVEQFSELGSGFNIAMKDLDIRGAGNLLGGEQSGFVMNMGYEAYQKILNEAIQELKETDYKDLFKEEMEQKRAFVKEVNVESDLDMMIPDEYVVSIKERLALYQELNKFKEEKEIERFSGMMIDRFGQLPSAVLNLMESLRIRWIAKELGFERIMLKNRKLRCYFIGDQQSGYFDSPFFKSLIAQIQKTCDHRFYLKQSAKYLMLVCEGVKNMKEVTAILQDLEEKVDAVSHVE